MNSSRTATTDGFGRSAQITNGRFVATMMTGLLPVADMVSRIQLLAPFEKVLACRAECLQKCGAAGGNEVPSGK